MVVAEKMKKSFVKVSVSGSDSSGSEQSGASEQSGVSEDEMEIDMGGAEADAESVSSADSDESENELLITNEGWADSVAKILGSSKPKNKKTLVLSRAKKFSEVVKKEVEEKPAFEVVEDGDIKQVKTEKDAEVKDDPDEPVVKKKKIDKPTIRKKPNILEKDRERLLSKIATKGVVQLFNAVRNQQKTIEKETESKDLSESKKEKVLKKFDKRSFLDTLMGQTKSVVVDEAKRFKNEVKDEEQPRWSALRDDFMTGAKMKDWDKESVDE